MKDLYGREDNGRFTVEDCDKQRREKFQALVTACSGGDWQAIRAARLFWEMRALRRDEAGVTLEDLRGFVNSHLRERDHLQAEKPRISEAIATLLRYIERANKKLVEVNEFTHGRKTFETMRLEDQIDSDNRRVNDLSAKLDRAKGLKRAIIVLAAVYNKRSNPTVVMQPEKTTAGVVQTA